MAVVLLMSGTSTFGQDNFDPAFPVEPGAPGTDDLYYSRIVLLKNIDDGGSVSGAGRYPIDKNVTVYAYLNTGYYFINWTDTKGNELSTSTSFSFLNTENTDTLIANYAFDPSMPSEPLEPSTTLYYRLVLKNSLGLSVSGGGQYIAGNSVGCNANLESGYRFLGWYRNDGTLVSNNTSFSFIMPASNDTLTARCVFDPDLPSGEPGSTPTDLLLKHNITVTCSDGGYWSGTSGRVLEGTSFSLYAYCNSGYEFKGWYLNGELYTMLSSFSYTMGKEDLNFFAKFEFNPGFPSEPNMPALSQYSYYLPTVNGRPGDTVKYAINLVNTEVVKDLNIRLTFPEGVVIEPTNYTLSNKAIGYDVTICEAVDSISIIEEGAKLWDFTMIGGTTEPATQALLTFDVFLPDTIDTGHRHQVKINQISMTMADGTAVTARTRNGLIGVFRLGDANGDDGIDVGDLAGVALLMMDKLTDDLIHVSADMDNNDIIEEVDYDILVDSVLVQPGQQSPSSVKENRPMLSRRRLSQELQTDNVLELPQETVIRAGQDNVVIPVNLLNTKAVTGFQFDLYMPDDVEVSTDEMGDFVINLLRSQVGLHNIYVKPLDDGGVRVLCSSKSNAAFSGNSGDVLELTLNLAGSLSEGSYDVAIRNIVITDDYAHTYQSEDVSTLLTISNVLLGDVNSDGYVDLSDAIMVTYYSLHVVPASFNAAAADMNGDGEIDLSDAIVIIYKSLGVKDN